MSTAIYNLGYINLFSILISWKVEHFDVRYFFLSFMLKTCFLLLLLLLKVDSSLVQYIRSGVPAPKGNTPPFLVGVQTCTTTMEINMVVPEKIWNQTTLRYSYLAYAQMMQNSTKRTLLNYVHYSFFHNNQKL